MFRGIGASPGVAIGKALVYKEEEIKIDGLPVKDINSELNALEKALTATKNQLQAIKTVTEKRLGADKAAIFEAHIMILEDPEMLSQVKDKLSSEGVSAAFALKSVVDSFVSIFDAMGDAYLKERAADIKDVGGRLLKNLLGLPIVDLSTLEEEVILVAHDLTPSDTATMNLDKVLGFITNIGGRTSHTAIMARTLEIPAIVGIGGITELVKAGDIIVLDGSNGEGYINPDSVTLEAFENKARDYREQREKLLALKDSVTITKDNRRVELACNIGTPKDVKGVLENGGEGVGLYRTEFLYMNRSSMPSEEEQFEAYREVLEKLEGKPVIIRTLDIGGDKELPYLSLPKEMNPFLGYRAIRICLDQPEIFKTQLRALLRASIYGNLKIMYPMISSVEEVRAANKILAEVKAELDAAKIPYSSDIEVGIMIEIPSAAVIGDMLIKEVDFFSIGTNDLIQYSTAVDRINEKISHLYEPFHPAVLRLIKLVIDHAHNGGKWVGMCGEMAGDTKLIPVLLGLGLDEFSMSAGAVLPARELIRGLSYQQLKKLAEGTLLLPTAEEIKKYVQENMTRSMA